VCGGSTKNTSKRRRQHAHAFVSRRPRAILAVSRKLAGIIGKSVDHQEKEGKIDTRRLCRWIRQTRKRVLRYTRARVIRGGCASSVRKIRFTLISGFSRLWNVSENDRGLCNATYRGILNFKSAIGKNSAGILQDLSATDYIGIPAFINACSILHIHITRFCRGDYSFQSVSILYNLRMHTGRYKY